VASEALGLPVEIDISDEDLIVSVCGVAEVMQEDGTMAVVTFNTDPMSAWQQLGMLSAGVVAVEMDLKEAWRD